MESGRAPKSPYGVLARATVYGQKVRGPALSRTLAFSTRRQFKCLYWPLLCRCGSEAIAFKPIFIGHTLLARRIGTPPISSYRIDQRLRPLKLSAERHRLFFAGVLQRALHNNITICWNVLKTHRPVARFRNRTYSTRCVCYNG